MAFERDSEHELIWHSLLAFQDVSMYLTNLISLASRTASFQASQPCTIRSSLPLILTCKVPTLYLRLSCLLLLNEKACKLVLDTFFDKSQWESLDVYEH